MSEKELFKKAFIEAEKAEYKDYLDKDIEWQTSSAFDDKMNILLNKNKRVKFSSRRRISSGLVAALIAILIAFAGTMSVSATRAPFVEFVKKVLPHYVEISLSKDSTPPVKTIEKEYTLSVVPQGYKMTSYDKTQYYATTTWTDGDKVIVFDQSILDMVNIIDNEKDYEEFELDGYKAYYYNSNLMWTDGKYWFDLGATNYNKKQLVELAESIKEKN